MKSSRGFSLIELMVAMAIVAIVVVYLMETFTVNNRTYVALDHTIEAQQNMRAIASLIERDVMHAGMMVPAAAAVCGLDSTSAPDTFYVTDHEAIDPGDDVISYNGIRITGNPTNVTSGSVSTLNLASLVVESSPARPAYDADGNGTPDSDFRDGGGVIVVDLNDPGRGVACGAVGAVDVGNTKLAVLISSGTLGTLTGTADLVAIPAIEYRINGGILLRDGLPLARGVEDLQVAYLFDLNGDGTLAASEVRGAASGTGYTANSLSVVDLRKIRINLVTRTRLEDPRFNEGSFQSMENRAAVAGNDGFRRRAYTSTIMPRNLVNRMDS